VICNADEGDRGRSWTGLFWKVIPTRSWKAYHLCHVLGCSQGYIYTRMEYPLAVKSLKTAIEHAKQTGFLAKIFSGPDSISTSRFFRAGGFHLRRSSALMYSIEGKRGFPRVRPPQSIESGLRQRPPS